MGEVYRAKDTRLKRDVAVKVLPEAFARDAGRMARFQREAEVLAALNHLNIAQIYGAEEHALVMELVEGPTLAERIQQGAVPVEESIEIARQIAEALEAAHEKGIIHRDLKPANVKIKADGTVKVLDFGLAAILQTTDSGATDPANSPTLTIGPTQTGVIMGTAGYMSPEQAVGKPVDRRADIWSFGVVLFEMLTGQRLFTGETASHILADVIKGEIDFGKVPSATPAAIRHLLKRCLDRDVKMRLQAIGEARVAIANTGKDAEPAATGASRSRFGNVGWVAAAVLAVVAAVAGWDWWHSPPPAEKPLIRLDVDLGPDISLPPPGLRGNAVVISRDGTRIAYVAGRLYTRRLDQEKPTELPGTQGAASPFFSPDGQWIGFTARNTVNKISVEGGAAVSLSDVPVSIPAAWWSEDGYIYTSRDGTGILRVPAAGGAPTKVTELNAGKELAHAYPQPLPGGKALLFTAYTIPPNPDRATLEVFTLADRRRKVLVPGGIYGRYLLSGHLIYGSKGTLFAVPFDLDKLELRGTPIPVLNDVANDYPASGKPQVEVSRNGTLVYRRGAGLSGLRTMQWVDAAGRVQVLREKPEPYAARPFLSPDGKRVAYVILDGGIANFWAHDWQSDRSTKLTFSGDASGSVVWSPDGKYVIAGTVAGMFWMPSDGSSQPQQLTQSKIIQVPWSFAPDGKRLAYFEIDISSQTRQIWTLPLEHEGGQWKAGKPEQFLKTNSVDQFPNFSPDGRWLAYVSNESSTNEVSVRPFPLTASGQGGKWPISTGGGTNPVWSRAGHELLYQSGDKVMAVSYSTRGDTFVADKPRVWTEKLGGAQGFDISPDGKRLAVIMPAQAAEAPKQEHEIVFLLNFFDELRRRAPLNK
jgi:serine/threonine-protein kinase